MIKVQLFRGEAGARSLAPAWRSLTAKLPRKRHFHHVEWYLALAHTFERHNLFPLQSVAAFSETGELLAVFPLRFIRVQAGELKLNAARLASDHTDAQTARDCILAPGLAEAGFFPEFVRTMAATLPGWDVIELPGLLEDSFALAAVNQCADIPVIRTPGGAWGRIELISCGEADQPFAALSKGFRQNLRTSHNKLKANQITFEAATSESDLLRLLPEFLRVESSGWKGEAGTSVAKLPAADTFVRQLITHFGQRGCCEIRLMRIDNEPIATLFGIVTDGTWYIFRIGYDEAHHRASPGHLIVENLLQHRGAQNAFDVLTPYNAPPWFHAWKPDKTLAVFNAYVFAPSPKGAELAKQTAAILQTPRQ